MTANRIIHHIFNQPDIRHVDQAELERLVEMYPYFAAARLLLAQKQYIQRPDLTAPALRKAQLYSSNPQHLHQLLTDISVFEEAPAVAETPVPAAVDIEEIEDTISAEDQQILDELEAEDRANAELAARYPNAVVEHIHIVEEEKNYSPLDEMLEEEDDEFEEEEPVLENKGAVVEEAPVAEEEIAAEEEPREEEIGTVEEAPVVEEETETTTEEEPAAEEQSVIEKQPAAEAEQLATEEQPTAKATAAEHPATEETLSPAASQDEVIAPGYEAIKEEKAFEEARTSDEPDEIVAIDYEAIKEEKAFEEARTSDAPDEIVALDYEAIKEEKAFEEARTSDAPDEIVAIDYEALKEEEKLHYEPEIEEEDILVEAGAAQSSQTTGGLSIPAATATTEKQTIISDDDDNGEGKLHYEPEIEEEDIAIAAENTQPAGGISIPAAAETNEKQTIITDDEAEDNETAEEEGPIRIHPIDTPEEETVLTFQPLYTEDYFAYKKLKDPNTAEMMNEKAQAEMRSFTDWLRELKDNFIAGKATKDWYHQQMHRLYEDDEPEVSERVEKMAMESITLNDDIVSETLAEIWVRQHQHAKAIAVYQKLSLLNPGKNAYFAQKIKELQLLTDNNK